MRNQFIERWVKFYAGANLQNTIDIQINPHETGSKFQWIEVNDIEDDRYET
jgi:hypothetical protein